MLWMSDDNDNDQKTLVKQEKLQNLEQGREQDEVDPPHRRQRARSYLTVVPGIAESA